MWGWLFGRATLGGVEWAGGGGGEGGKGAQPVETVETTEEGVEAQGVGVEASVFGLQVVCVELEAPHTSEEGQCGRDWARRPWVLASRLRPVGG